MFSCPGQAYFTCCPARSITFSFPSSQRTQGSDKPAGTSVERKKCPILWLGRDRAGPDVGLERVMLEGREGARSPCWSPGSPHDLPRGQGCAPSVHHLLAAPSRRATSTPREKDPTFTLAPPGQCLPSDAARHLPAWYPPGQHWAPGSWRVAVLFAGLARGPAPQ